MRQKRPKRTKKRTKKKQPRKTEVRSEQNSGQTCHTAREQLVFILNEASVGVFQVASSKNSPVTLHSNWQPSAGQRDGVWGGRNSNTLHHHQHQHQHQPPKHASACVSDMAWTARREETCVTDSPMFVFPKHRLFIQRGLTFGGTTSHRESDEKMEPH